MAVVYLRNLDALAKKIKFDMYVAEAQTRRSFKLNQ